MKKMFWIVLLVVILGFGSCGQEKDDISGLCEAHEWEWRSIQQPTCADTYEAQEICIRCGFAGDILTLGPDAHIWEDTVVTNGNCTDPKVVSHICKECGARKQDTVNYENRARALHDYQPYSGSCVEPEYNAVVFYRCDKCSRCGEEINRQQTGFEPIAPEEAR